MPDCGVDDHRGSFHASNAPMDWPMNPEPGRVDQVDARSVRVEVQQRRLAANAGRLFQTGRESLAVVPRSTLGSAGSAPALTNSASVSVVLPMRP